MIAERGTLRVRRDDGLHDLDPSRPNGGFAERQHTIFIGPADRECRLLVDDEPLERVEESANEWSWKPGFYAGEVRAELLDADDRSLGVWLLDVSPDREKTGREVFARMVDEILDFDPHLVIGEEPARRRLGALGDSDDPLVLFERLRRRRRDLERALAAIRREPVSVLRARRQFVPLRDTRRADLRTLRSALRQPATLAAIRPGTASSPCGPGSDPILDVPAVERTLDSPANRCILAMLRALLLRCRELSNSLKGLAQKPPDDTRTAVANRVDRWNQILDEMGRTFATAERRRPFGEVRRPEITAAGLNAVAAHPLYARFWRVGWEALRRGLYRLDPEDRLPLSPTWEIYERWCFVALAWNLREWLPEYEWKTVGRSDSDRRTFTGTRDDGRSIKLHLQRTFANTRGREADESWSISGKFRPDLVLTSQCGDGPMRFVVLDAKYRASAAGILSGMTESAHPYALLLVPNAAEAEWMTRTDYVDRHRVGVVALRPDLELPDWFRVLMTDHPRPGV